MANVYPTAGPRQPVQSPGEEILYHRFKQLLPSTYHVVHSVWWDRPTGKGYRQPGQADFVIVHPKHGVLVLEVKHSPRIRYLPEEGIWVLENANGTREPGGNPFEQAMKSVQTLLAKISTLAATKPFAARYRINYAVWLTQATWQFGRWTGATELDGQVLDVRDLGDPEAGLERVFQSVSGETEPAELSDPAIAAIMSFLEPATRATGPWIMQGPLAQGERAIKCATEAQQLLLMDLIHRSPQLAIPGHAGTGKTVIAQELAWHLAQQGVKTLLLCANLSLADYLRDRQDVDPRADSKRFDVMSLYELVRHFTREARLKAYDINRIDAETESGQVYAAEVLGRCIKQLRSEGRLQLYDALLVDEAQDINAPIWPLLRELHSDPQNGYYVAFYDLAQRDLPGAWDVSWADLPVASELVVNCRNSGHIYDLMRTFNPRLNDMPCSGEPGEPVQYIEPAGGGIPFRDPETETLKRVLDDLVSEGCPPHDILIITCRSREKTRWWRSVDRTLGGHNLRELKGKAKPGFVKLSTIRSAKGLESPVVILAELDGVAKAGKRNALLYTAVARARTRLIVLSGSLT